MVRASAFRPTWFTHGGNPAEVAATHDDWGPARVPNPPRSFGIEHLQGLVPVDAAREARHAHAAGRRFAFAASGKLRTARRASVGLLTISHHDDEHLMAGFLVTVLVDDDGLLPHEDVDPVVVDDRLDLRRRVGMDLSPILLASDGAEVARHLDVALRAARRTPPDIVLDTADGQQRVWFAVDEHLSSCLLQDLLSAQLLVLDGHHRLEAARQHHVEEAAPAGAEQALALICAGRWLPALEKSEPPMSKIWEAARAGRTLAAKSTTFRPKPRSGLIMRSLSDRA